MTTNVVQNGLPTLMSEEWRVAVAPRETYAALVSDPGASSQLFARVALILLVFATIASTILTDRITIPLVATGTLSWSFVLVLQIAIGTLIILSAPTRRVSVVRALDLWFASHLPFSLWLLLIASWFGLAETFPPFVLVLSVVVPAIWTSLIAWAYCRVVLGVSVRGAQWRVALHQSMAWLCVIAFLIFASGGPTSLVISLARQIGLRS
jgi:hypothetical protein